MRTTILSTILFFTGLTMQAQAPDGVVAVDLGLPSGTKWANMNVGATRPGDYGERYAWAELEPKKCYNNEIAKYNNSLTYGWAGNSDYHFTWRLKHDISGTNDDVAHVKWGGKWRMPSLADFEELYQNCGRNSEWMNGTYGIKFTGPNGQSIFLFENYTSSRWKYGYWTSTPQELYNYYHQFMGGYDSGASHYWDNYIGLWKGVDKPTPTKSWLEGLYIRPVMDDKTELSEVPLICLNEDEDFTPIDTTGIIIKMAKTLYHGWNTLVLPFTPTKQDSIIFNYNNYKLYEFVGYENGVFNFKSTNKASNSKLPLYSHIPYLVYYSGQTQKVSKYFTEYYHGGYQKMKLTTGTPVKEKNNYSFTGTYETRTIPKGNITGRDYILEGRSFRKVEASDTLRGFSAYMRTLLPDSLDDGSPIRIAIDGVLLEPRVLLDEIATTTPENETNVDVQVNINIPANQWNTICLPFDMNREQVKTAFGDDVQIADFVNWNSVEENDSAKIVNLLFSKGITAIECGHPYLIKTTKDITGFATNKVTINTSKYPMVETFDEENQRFGYFAGTYTTNYIWRSVYLKDGQPCLSPEEEDCTINAFRGYFRLYGNNIIHKDTQINLTFIDTEKGDINGDGKLSIDDIAALIRLYYKDTGTVKSIDIDGDEKFTINDITQLIIKFCNR